ncbi:uncharacterized protein LOC116302126 [Actinia tenebrosa]|uniref:Uncharacterized protein LOC116302126 n=1 Tax=Actinia tenebrosa TaxID=6105 RepID=A0A6P8ILB0_ACTTE|nr:uncharacterized protein LOC116302126 [Actinia tenebrosa]
MKNIAKYKILVALSVVFVCSLCSYKILSKIWSNGTYDFSGTSRTSTRNGFLNLPWKPRKGSNKQDPLGRTNKNRMTNDGERNSGHFIHKVIPISKQGKKEFYEEQKRKQCGVGWQKRYVEYHKQVLRSERPGKFLVYLCGGKDYGCGGYGNRLNGIASLLLLAILTDRVFLIDWNYSISLKDYFLPNKIDWSFSLDKIDRLNSSRSYWGAGHPAEATIGVRRPFKDHSHFKDFITETDFRTHFDRPVEIVTAMWYFVDALKENRFLNGKLSEMSLGDRRFSWIGCAFDFLFAKTKAIEERLQEARTSTGIGQGMPTIGMHIRMGDTVFGKMSQKGSIRTRNYMTIVSCTFALEKAIHEANPQISKARLRIFLASDDVNLKRLLLKKYPSFVSLDVKVEHISFFRRKKNLPSKEGMVGVLLDHFLLSECDFLVLSRSTFGMTAAGLTFHPKESYTLKDKCSY